MNCSKLYLIHWKSLCKDCLNTEMKVAYKKLTSPKHKIPTTNLQRVDEGIYINTDEYPNPISYY